MFAKNIHIRPNTMENKKYTNYVELFNQYLLNNFLNLVHKYNIITHGFKNIKNK